MKKLPVLLGAVLALVLGGIPFLGLQPKAETENVSLLYGQPTVILEGETESVLDSMQETTGVSSVKFLLGVQDEVLSVKDARGKVLCTLEEAYAKLPKGASVIAEVSDDTALALYADFAKEKGIKNPGVLSSDITVLNAASSAVSGADLFYAPASASTTQKCLEELKTANVLGIQVLVLSHADASVDNVRYLQARFKSVWVETDGSAAQVADAIGSGACGIITSDVQTVRDLFVKIAAASDTDADGYPMVITRTPFVAAHKGDHMLYLENSAEAVAEAAKIGATHVEIDIRLTKDGQVVVFHNDQISYNGQNVNVNSLTLDEIKSIDLPNANGCKVPTLEEVFDAVLSSGNDELVMVIELKGKEADLVPLFAAKVRQYDMTDRIVLISFYETQLDLARELLPNTSVSLLQYLTDGDTALTAAKTRGAGIDMAFNIDSSLKATNIRTKYGNGTTTSSAYLDVFRTFADRGYSLWMWTYDLNSMTEAFRYGVTGITTDDPRYASDKIEKLQIGQVISVEALPQNGDTIEIPAITYKGESTTVPAKVIYLNDKNTEAVLVCRREGEIGLVSQSVTFRIEEGGSADESAGGCSSVAVSSALAVSGVLLLAGILFTVWRKAN